MRTKMKYTRNELSFLHKKILFTLFFIAGEMKYIVVSAMIGVKQHFKKYKQTSARYRDKKLEATMQTFAEEVLGQINTVTDKNSKFISMRQMDLTSNVSGFKLLSNELQRMEKFYFQPFHIKSEAVTVLKKRCSENMQQIYRRTPMSKFEFNKVAMELY